MQHNNTVYFKQCVFEVESPTLVQAVCIHVCLFRGDGKGSVQHTPTAGALS